MKIWNKKYTCHHKWCTPSPANGLQRHAQCSRKIVMVTYSYIFNANLKEALAVKNHTNISKFTHHGTFYNLYRKNKTLLYGSKLWVFIWFSTKFDQKWHFFKDLFFCILSVFQHNHFSTKKAVLPSLILQLMSFKIR